MPRFFCADLKVNRVPVVHGRFGRYLVNDGVITVGDAEAAYLSGISCYERLAETTPPVEESKYSLGRQEPTAAPVVDVITEDPPKPPAPVEAPPAPAAAPVPVERKGRKSRK